MTKFVLRIVGSALNDITEHDDRYVMHFDADNPAPHGTLTSTGDITKALQFENGVEALECWRRQSRRRPLRPDGKPNRPLTAFTIELVKV